MFAVLLIINTIPRNLYADGEDVAPVEQEPIVETVAEPEPEPEPAPEPEPVSEAQPNAPPAEPAALAEPEPVKEEPADVKQEEAQPAEPAKEKAAGEPTEELPAEEADEKAELPAQEAADASKAEKADEDDAVETEESKEEITYVIYFEASENGLVLIDGNDPIKKEVKTKQEVKAKEEIKAVTAEANEGFEFEEWQLNGVSFSKEATLSAGQIELKDQDRYTALFKEVVEEAEIEEISENEEQEKIEELEELEEDEIKFQIFFEASEHGTIVLAAEGSAKEVSIKQEVIKEEELISVNAEAEEGYEFVEWLLNGESFSEEAELKAESIELNDQDKYVALFKEIEVEEEPEIEIWPKEFSALAGGMIVRVVYDEGTFPEGTEMVVTPIPEEQVYDAVNEKVEGTVTRIKAVDISFYADGQEVQPKKFVSVYMKAYGYDDSKDQQIVHIDDKNKVDVVTSAEANGGSVETEFDTKSFSIYAIVESGADARLTVNFISGSDTIASQIVKRSDITSGIFDQIVYDPGAGSLGSNEVFRGWTTVENYTVEGLTNGDNPPMTIDAVRNDVKVKLEAGVNDGDSVTYYAMVFNVINVTYKDEDSVVIRNEGLLTKGDTVDYTVNETYVPKTSDQEFQGWYITSSGTVTDEEGNPIADGSVIVNGTKIKITSDVILNVKAPKGYWLIFKENGSGASYTPPQFLEGVKPTEPSDPARFGFDFDGWYTDAACTEGNEFNFDQLLETTTTVYAKWTEVKTARYTVIIWKQNAKDAKNAADSAKTYDFAESISLNGNVGATINTVSAAGSGDNRYARVNGVDKRYTGFHLGRYDQNVTINSSGTAVVNVYFDRNLITLTFQYRQGGRWNTQATMTGLYGSTLADNGYTWPTNRWWYDDYIYYWGDYYGAGTRTTFMDAFILTDGSSSQTFYGFDGNGDNHVYFYKQGSDGNYPTTPTNTVVSGNGTFYISDKYNGYHAVAYSTNNSTWTSLGEKDSDGYYAAVSDFTNLHIRFAPDLYKIKYNDGIYVDGDNIAVEGYSSRGELKVVDNIPYASDVSSYNKGNADYYAPTFSGFVFDGWYLDDACTSSYTFTTMPEGLVLYAKWIQKEYRVFLHPNVPTSDTSFSMGGQNTSFRVSNGGSISSITAIRDDYELVGWYLDEDCTTAINFDAFSVNDTSVTTTYDQTQPTETDKYGNPTGTENKDATNNRYWITTKLDLYAKWRSKLKGANGITVVYDAVDGSFSGGGKTYTDPLTYKDLSKAVTTTASTAPDTDTEFEYWVVQKWNGTEFVDTDETVYPGDTFEVKKSYANVTENEGSTEEDPSYTYTVKLRAEYKPIEEETLTHIYWYANNETDAKESYENVHMNTALDIEPANLFTYEGHEFAGWARWPETEKPSSPTDTTNLWLEYKGGKYYIGDKEVNKIACDEKTPYHDLYAVWKPIVSVRVSADTQNVTYNGSEQRYDYSAENAYKVEYKVGKAEWTTTKPEGITLTETKPVISGIDAGTYTGTVEISISVNPGAYYIVTSDSSIDSAVATLIIDPKEVTVTAKSEEFVYDGKAHSDNNYTVSGLVGDDAIEATVTGSITFPSESPVTNKLASYEFTAGKADNYTVTTVNGELTMTEASAEITITAADGEWTYDGSAHSDATVTLTAGELFEGDELVAEAEGSVTDVADTAAGNNTFKAGYKIMHGDKDVTDNYAITVKAGTLTINPAAVTITAGSASKAYDGTPLTKDEASIEGLVNSETATVKATGSQTSVGSSSNTYSIDWGTTKKDNYTVTENLGTLTVTTAPGPGLGPDPEPEPTPEPAPEPEIIDDDPTPEAEPEKYWALLNLLSSIGTVLTAAGMILTFFRKKKDDEEEEANAEGANITRMAASEEANEEEEDDENKRKKSKFLGLIPAIGSVIFFILTEDMRNKMIWTDKYTLAMVLILLANFVIAYLTRNKKKDDDEEDGNKTEGQAVTA